MGQGNYDHPSYLTRQQIVLGQTVAGANGTSLQTIFNSQMRIRNVSGCVTVAGTVGTNVRDIIFSGTTALGTITYGTNGVNIGATGTSGDLNATIPVGTVLAVKNGADATGVTQVVLEAYLDESATWTGTTN